MPSKSLLQPSTSAAQSPFDSRTSTLHEHPDSPRQSLSNEKILNAKALEAGVLDVDDEQDNDDPQGETTKKEEDSVLIVDWDGPEDPLNPRNWSYKKKWAATAIVSAFTFISPVSSSMIAPASDQVALDFGITNSVVIAMTTSIFVLAFALGPLFLGPLSEIYGRSRVLQAANMFYLVWNLVCGFAQSEVQLIIFRFLAGLGGSAPLSIGGGVLGDLWKPEERGQAIALYSLAPLLGPVIGPICGAWIAERSSWRWVFWSTTIVDGFVQILGLFFLRETFAPTLLERKANKIKKERGIPKQDTHYVRTPFQSDDRHWKRIFAKAITRPFALFFYEPIIQLLGTYMAFIYGTLYLALTTLPSIFGPGGIYNERIGIAGLNYIALGVGLTGASQLNARMLDRIYVYCKQRFGNGVGKPEYRLPSMFIGTILLPAGLFIAGWAAEKKTFWLVPDIGIALIGGGMILNFQCIQTYTIDAFTLHAASALAAVSCLRSLAGFGFPLFAPAMYNALGFGKGNTVLGVLAIVIGCPAPWLFWNFGERIRRHSKFATKHQK